MCAAPKPRKPAPPPPPIQAPELEIPAADSPSAVRRRKAGRGRSTPAVPSAGLQIPAQASSGGGLGI